MSGKNCLLVRICPTVCDLGNVQACSLPRSVCQRFLKGIFTDVRGFSKLRGSRKDGYESALCWFKAWLPMINNNTVLPCRQGNVWWHLVDQNERSLITQKLFPFIKCSLCNSKPVYITKPCQAIDPHADRLTKITCD